MSVGLVARLPEEVHRLLVAPNAANNKYAHKLSLSLTLLLISSFALRSLQRLRDYACSMSAFNFCFISCSTMKMRAEEDACFGDGKVETCF